MTKDHQKKQKSNESIYSEPEGGFTVKYFAFDPDFQGKNGTSFYILHHSHYDALFNCERAEKLVKSFFEKVMSLSPAAVQCLLFTLMSGMFFGFACFP